MAHAGNSYTITLSLSHLKWGEYRNPTNRNIVYGEGYIPIPKSAAQQFGIFNSNASNTGFGYNRFYVSSKDGFLQNEIMLAQGCTEAGDIYAKQFSIEGDLKRIGQWYSFRNAKPGDRVEVTWISSTDVEIEIL